MLAGAGVCGSSPGGCGTANLRGSPGTAGHATRSTPPPQPGDVAAPDQPPDAAAAQHAPFSASAGTITHQQDASPTGRTHAPSGPEAAPRPGSHTDTPASNTSQRGGGNEPPSHGAKAAPSSSSSSTGTPKVALLFLLQSRSLPLANEALWAMFLQQAADAVARAEAASAASAPSASVPASSSTSTSASASASGCGSEEGTGSATELPQEHTRLNAGQQQQQLFRSPPPDAAVRAALHVDLEEVVGSGGGGGLKPPLPSYDEVVYPGYIQQHLLAAANPVAAAGRRSSTRGRGPTGAGGGRRGGATTALSQEGQQQQQQQQQQGTVEDGYESDGSQTRLREREREMEAVRLAARRLADELLGPFPCSCRGPDRGPGNSHPAVRSNRTDAAGRTKASASDLADGDAGGYERSSGAGGVLSPGGDENGGAESQRSSCGTAVGCAGLEVAGGKDADTGDGSSTCGAVAEVAAEARQRVEQELEALIAAELRRQRKGNAQQKQQGNGREKRRAAAPVDTAGSRGGARQGACEPCTGNSGTGVGTVEGKDGGVKGGGDRQQAQPRQWAEEAAGWLTRQVDTMAWRALPAGRHQVVSVGGRKAVGAVDEGRDKETGAATASVPPLVVWLAERAVRRQLLAAAPKQGSGGGGVGWGLLASWAWHVASRALRSWLRPAAGAADAYAGLLPPFVSTGEWYSVMVCALPCMVYGSVGLCVHAHNNATASVSAPVPA